MCKEGGEWESEREAGAKQNGRRKRKVNGRNNRLPSGTVLRRI